MAKSAPHSDSELRKIPGVDTLLVLARDRGIFRHEVDAFRVYLVRRTLKKIRDLVLSGSSCPEEDKILSALSREIDSFNSSKMRPIINATGIVLHTNLGRAPLNEDVLEKTIELANGYANLEFNLNTGQRGKRGEWVTNALAILTGAEKALVVNNCAASVFHALTTFASGKEVIISRGELVQIGGGFRIPDILKASGAILHEVGTTNITTIADYSRAINKNTAVILKVHRSNFYLEGHTEEASLQDLRKLADLHEILLFFDLGSGDIVPRPLSLLPDEVKVQDGLIHGAHLVTTSCDKLLGGPQGGVTFGEKKYIDILANHPLYRVFRPGRLTLASLQEVIQRYLSGESKSLTSWAMLSLSPEEILARAEKFKERLKTSGIEATIEKGEGAVGGGTLPDDPIESWLIALKPQDAEVFLTKLRQNETPVIPRISKDRIFLDLRTVLSKDEDLLFSAVTTAFANSTA